MGPDKSPLGSNKLMNIKLSQNNFKERSLYRSSQTRLEIGASTSMLETMLFSNKFIHIDDSICKVNIRCG
jgi:hypothetical protein